MDRPTPYSLESAPSVASAQTTQNPHYQAIGGAPAVARLAERFYHHLATLPEAREIRALHEADLDGACFARWRFYAKVPINHFQVSGQISFASGRWSWRCGLCHRFHGATVAAEAFTVN